SSNAFVIDYGRGSVQKNKENIEKKSGLIGHSDKNESEIDTEMQQVIEFYKNSVDRYKPINGLLFPIPLQENKIVSKKCYNLPLHLRDKLKEHIKMLLIADIIRPSTSVYATPTFVIMKPNGDIRLVNDYRDLNKLSVELEYFFPSVTEAFLKIRGSKVFSQIDLEKGFYQVAIDENDKFKTAFTCPFGKYEHNRLPFGLKNAPKFFNNAISTMLNEFDNVMVFIDDILIFSKNVEDNMTSLKNVMKKLAENNVIINFEKSNLLKDEVRYLGFVLNGENYRPNEDRLKDFHKWKKPQTRRQLQKLLGKLNFYSSFIKNMGTRIAHLYDKLKGHAIKVNVSDEEMIPVFKIYDELRNHAINYLPDANQEFIIHVDASDLGVGAVLSQKNGIVAYYSKKFSDIESRYTTTEKEALAALKAIEKWQDMVSGSKIIIYTDSKNNLSKNGNLSKRIERWKALLSDYDIEYRYSQFSCFESWFEVGTPIFESVKMNFCSYIMFFLIILSYYMK
ncbi:pol polyprotein, partial [Pseudoloma neurophilia]